MEASLRSDTTPPITKSSGLSSVSNLPVDISLASETLQFRAGLLPLLSILSLYLAALPLLSSECTFLPRLPCYFTLAPLRTNLMPMVPIQEDFPVTTSHPNHPQLQSCRIQQNLGTENTRKKRSPRTWEWHQHIFSVRLSLTASVTFCLSCNELILALALAHQSLRRELFHSSAFSIRLM